MAIPTIVATAFTDSNGNRNELEVSLPQSGDGVQNGDVIVVGCGSDQQDGGPTVVDAATAWASAGWSTRILAQHSSTGQAAVWYAVVTDAASIPATTTFDIGGNRESFWAARAVRGVSTADIEGWSNAGYSQPSYGEGAGPTSDADCLLLGFGGNDGSLGDITYTATDWTHDGDGYRDWTVDAAFWYGHIEQATAGTVDQDDLNAGNTSDCCITLALPGAAGTPSGSGTVAASAALAGSGHKAGAGSGTVAASAALAGSGHKVAAVPSGSGTVTASVTLAGSGHKVEEGQGAVSVAVSMFAQGHKIGSGAGTVAVAAALAGSGADVGPIPSGSGTVTASVTLAGSGHKVEEGQGAVSVAVSMFAQGHKIGSGSGWLTSSVTLAGQGEPPPAVGVGVVTASVTLAGSGRKISARGSGSITVRTRLWGETRWPYLNGDPDLVLSVELALGAGPLFDVAKWGSAQWVEDLAWLDVSSDVAAVKTRSSARASINDAFRAGSASVRLQNPRGRYTITGLIPGAYVDLRPGIRCRVSVSAGGTKRTVWTGYVSTLAESYGRQGQALLDVQAVDGMERLTSARLLAGNYWRQGASTSNATTSVLNAALWGTSATWRSIDTGAHTLAKYTVPDGTPALDVLRRIADAEGGTFYIDYLGRATFRERDWLTDTKGATPALYIDSEGLQDVEWRDLAPLNRSDSRVINQVTYRQEGTDDPKDNVYSTDPDSIGLWGPRAVERFDLLNEWPGQLQTLADRTVTQRGAVRPDIRSVGVRPADVATADKVNARRLGDVVRLEYDHPVTGWGWYRDANIVGIEHAIDKVGAWTVTLALDTTYQES